MSKLNRNEVRGACGTAKRIKEVSAAVGLVAGWLVYSTKYSSKYQHYYLSVIHTRPVPGAPRKSVLDKDVTHEFLLIPLNPARNPSIDYPQNFCPVLPEIYRGQVTSLTDKDAQIICEAIANALISGTLPLLWEHRDFFNAYITTCRENLQAGEKFMPETELKGKG